MKLIAITKGKFAIVDDECYNHLNKFNWYAVDLGNTTYVGRAIYPKGQKGKKISLFMHREIMKCNSGDVVDHINGNGLDNRKENLRVVTTRVNLQNRHQKKSSKYVGVSWHCQHKKWQSRIAINDKNRHLGYYSDEETAGIIYAMACNALKMGCKL